MANPRAERVKAVRRLNRRVGRERAGRFVAEGPQAVREAIAAHAALPGNVVHDLFVTDAAAQRYAGELALAQSAGLTPVHVSDAVAAAMTDTVAPQGLLAICASVERTLEDVLRGLVPTLVAVLVHVRDPGNAGTVLRAADAAGADAVVLSHDSVDVYNPKCVRSTAGSITNASAITVRGLVPTLVAVLVHVRDPGNAGTVLRAADAAGADAVVLSHDSVDVYNPKCVRSTAGSIFHLPVVQGVRVADAVAALRAHGMVVLAADGDGDTDLDDLLDDVVRGAREGVGTDRAALLARPTAWLFGNEAWGLDPAYRALADAVVRVPIHGRAESLNLATAATVCLYASARAHRAPGPALRSQR